MRYLGLKGPKISICKGCLQGYPLYSLDERCYKGSLTHLDDERTHIRDKRVGPIRMVP